MDFIERLEALVSLAKSGQLGQIPDWLAQSLRDSVEKAIEVCESEQENSPV